MKIFSIALSPHDHNTYDGKFHNQQERYTRLKHNIPYHKNLRELNQNDNSAGLSFYNSY